MIITKLNVEYTCPTVLLHLYKRKFNKLFSEGNLVKSAFFKSDGKFSPAGLLCDIWGQITGKGFWENDCRFNYETQTGSRAWAHASPPLPVTSSYINLKRNGCLASRFISECSFSDPSVVKEFLDKVPDFESAQIKGGDQWEVHYWDEDANNELHPVLHRVIVSAENCSLAHEEFKRIHPTGIIQRTIFVPKSVF